MRWLAYGHPVWMLLALGLAVLALRLGLKLRQGRLRQTPRADEDFAQHTRIAKPAVLMILLGFVGGPLSMWLLRDRDPFGTLHAWLGLLAALLFVAAAALGRRMEQGHGGDPNLHALVALGALLAGGAALVAGLVLLP